MLRINKKKFKYQNLLDIEPLLDEEGYDTGEKVMTYGEIIESKANILPATAEIVREYFGNDIDCSYVMFVDKDFDIHEESKVLLEEKEYIVKSIKPYISVKIVSIQGIS